MKSFIISGCETVLVDDEDFERVTALKWFVQRKPSGAKYAHRSYWINGWAYDLRLGRFVFGNVPDDKLVDHINGNGLDNQKQNLRVVDHVANLRGFQRKRHTATTSIFRGVYWQKDRKKWGACIGLNRKSKNIGSFETECEAALAFNKCATELGYPKEAMNEVACA